jgi:N-acylneuraminate cytidylyltransferase
MILEKNKTNKIAIITARGGSKRIPKKNIKHFLGKPIISYSIEIAINSGIFDEIMVSTDDEEIKKIALQYGAKVPFLRSKKNSDDFSTTLNVLDEVISNYHTIKNQKFDYACCIYPTSPLTTINHIIDGYKLLLNNNFDSTFPAIKFGYPIWRGLDINNNGISSMIWDEYLNSRSQDLKNVYHDAGQWYWFKPNLIYESLISGNAGALILKESEVQDIDNEEDWVLAELKYELKNNVS